MTGTRPRLHNEVYPFVRPSKFVGSLRKKVVVITGAVGTIGVAIGECFATSGATLVLVFNRKEPSSGTRDQLITLGAHSVTFIKCNVALLSECKALFQQVIETYGTIDILVNNAAVDSIGLAHTQDLELFADKLAINLNGPYFLTRLALSVFMDRREGCVLNIASRAGSVATPFNTTYSVSKAAVIRMTNCLQMEMNILGYKNIHMYALHPGAVASALASKEGLKKPFEDFPELTEGMEETLQGFKDSPYLSGMVCVALATGIAKDILKGRYFDVQHDLEDIIAQGEIVQNIPDIYGLHTTFPGQLPNDGGTELLPAEPHFEFPGY